MDSSANSLDTTPDGAGGILAAVLGAGGRSPAREKDADAARQARREEESIARAAAGGDLQAFEKLVRRYHDRVMATAWPLVGEEADDVAQEVWLRVHRALPRFRFRSSFTTWLYRITVNEAKSTLKRRSRRAGERRGDVRMDDAEGEFPIPAPGPGPRREAAGRELGRAFRKALAALPMKQRMAVVLVIFQGLPHREAGQVLGVREKTVSWHLFKAREKLSAELKEYL